VQCAGASPTFIISSEQVIDLGRPTQKLIQTEHLSSGLPFLSSIFQFQPLHGISLFKQV
jgi:hypothetical protein